MKKLLLIVLIGLTCILQAQTKKDFTILKGDYLGQTPSGDTPVVFAPGIVSVEYH